MAEQVKIMKLKVDLECKKCYKKVKKVLYKFPEIRDQVYDEKQNIVTIRVVSCNPEKIRDKLCYKGGRSIKSIEIVEPSKPKPAPPPKPKPAPPRTPKPAPPRTPKPAPPPKPTPIGICSYDRPPLPQPPPAEPDPQPPPPPPPPVGPAEMFPEPTPVSVGAYPPPVTASPIRVYYEGHAGYGGYCGRPIYDSYGGGGRPADMYRNDQYRREENASGCTIV